MYYLSTVTSDRIAKGTAMREITKAALTIPEMEYAFEIICADSRKEPDEFSDQEIVDEAEYRLSNFFENGHDRGDALPFLLCRKSDQSHSMGNGYFLCSYYAFDMIKQSP